MIYKSKITGVLMKLEKAGEINKFFECDENGNPANLKITCKGELKPQIYLTSSFKYLEKWKLQEI